MMLRFLSTNFTWSKDTRTLSTEMSSLNVGSESMREVEVESAHTGRVIKFRFVCAQIDGENDVQYWKYEPVYADFNHNVDSLVIFND